MRHPRQLQPESFVHVTMHCEDYFFKASEMRDFFLNVLKEAAQRFEFVLLGYCILLNHLHLLNKLHTDPTKLSQAIHFIATKMACHYNRVMHRRGHFWRERFRSTIIADSRHFKNVLSYIDANPLNTKDQIEPLNWHYCSFRELQSGDDTISLIDRFHLLKAMKMQNIKQFLLWQREMMERQKGSKQLAAAKSFHTEDGVPVRFQRHYAVGRRRELQLLQKRLRKRGIFTYGLFLEMDADNQEWWALHLCSERYAKRHQELLATPSSVPPIVSLQ